jgi:hypothetical protein
MIKEIERSMTMKSKRFILFVLALILLVAFAPMASMADEHEEDAFNPEMPAFREVSGVVTDITENHFVEGMPLLSLEDADGEPFGFVVTDEALNMTGEMPEIGDWVVAFYDTRRPMIMIYPPQYPVVAFMVADGEHSLFVGRFDETLLDETETLYVRITENTEIVDVHGEPFEASPAGQSLAFLYTQAAESDPLQIWPDQIIVLPEPEDYIFYESEELEPFVLDVSEMELIVEGVPVEAPPAWTTEAGIVMIPVKAVGEAVGYEVGWNGDHRSVTLTDEDSIVVMSIGSTAYTNTSLDAPVRLDTAPEIRDSRTFVPLDFFREVMQLNNAYVFENQIVIDNQELMR